MQSYFIPIYVEDTTTGEQDYAGRLIFWEEQVGFVFVSKFLMCFFSLFLQCGP